MNVRLIAHRGYAVHAPQNSAEAFEAAGKLGFWAIETDVRRTTDGALVCCHDPTVDGMFCGSGSISALPWDTLRRLDFREDKKTAAFAGRACRCFAPIFPSAKPIAPCPLSS